MLLISAVLIYSVSWFSVPDCCSEDAEMLRIHTLSNSGDIETLEKMIEDRSDSDDNSESWA